MLCEISQETCNHANIVFVNFFLKNKIYLHTCLAIINMWAKGSHRRSIKEELSILNKIMQSNQSFNNMTTPNLNMTKFIVLLILLHIFQFFKMIFSKDFCEWEEFYMFLWHFHFFFYVQMLWPFFFELSILLFLKYNSSLDIWMLIISGKYIIDIIPN